MQKKYHKSDFSTQKPFINKLVLFAIYSITEDGELGTFERITKECFAVFPQSFTFPKHPNWPDTRKIDWTLRDLRKKKLISGEPKTSFSLTVQGKKEAREIAKTLCQKKLL